MLLLLLLLLLIFGGVGLFVKGLIWLFWIALILFIIGLVFGLMGDSFGGGWRTGRRL